MYSLRLFLYYVKTAESEYTFRLKKAILPIRLQDRYYPDGWLGALVGSRLVHNFSGEFRDAVFQDLLRDLGERGRSSNAGT